ncbi:MAG: VWA domain-containing protein, partial [Bacteroidetes bacterium]|nr:VWA domain-containing protein [Bacteroidota bacterium]
MTTISPITRVYLYIGMLLLAFTMQNTGLLAQQFRLLTGSPDYSNYPEIRLPFEILDNSSTIDTLLSENFMVFENGVRVLPVEIECGDLKGAQKIHFFFIMDVSYSMAFIEGTTHYDLDSTKWRRAKEVFIQGFNSLRPQDEAALASFARDFVLEQDFTGNTQWLIDAAFAMALRPGTAIYTAIVNAVTLASIKNGKSVIILLTDGVDNQSRHTREQAVSIAWQAGIPVYPIGLGFYPDITDPNRVNQDTLRRLADGTGGKAHFAPTSEDLDGIFREIVASIYSIGCVLRYTSPDTCQDGRQRDAVMTADIQGILLEQQFSYTLPDLRSRLNVSIDVPAILQARQLYDLPVMVDGELREEEPLSFRMQIQYDPTTIIYQGLDAGTGILDPAAIRVDELQDGVLLLETVATMPSRGVPYGNPAALFSLRFLTADHDRITAAGITLDMEYIEQNCEIISTTRDAQYAVHGCPPEISIGFDTTLAVVSGGDLLLPIMLTPGLDYRQSLELSLRVQYDRTLLRYIGIDVNGTIMEQLEVAVDRKEGERHITSSPGIPADTDGVLLFLLFSAVDT